MASPGNIEELLVEGEQVIWSGSPDWNSSGHTPFWRGKVNLFLWSFVVALALVATIWIGGRVPEGAFYRPILQAFGVVLIVVEVGLLMHAVDFSKSARSPDEHYAVTNQRLLILDHRLGQRLSVAPGCIRYLTLVENGNAHDLWFSINDDDDDNQRVLYALKEGASIEKLLLENFVRRKAT